MSDQITQVGGGEMEIGTIQSIGVEIDLASRGIVLIAEFTAIDQLIVTGLGRIDGSTEGTAMEVPGGECSQRMGNSVNIQIMVI